MSHIQSGELCEWDPQHNRPAVYHPDGTVRSGSAERYYGCQHRATLSVGARPNNWHLCDDCAALPHFKRLRRRVKLNP